MRSNKRHTRHKAVYPFILIHLKSVSGKKELRVMASVIEYLFAVIKDKKVERAMLSRIELGVADILVIRSHIFGEIRIQHSRKIRVCRTHKIRVMHPERRSRVADGYNWIMHFSYRHVTSVVDNRNAPADIISVKNSFQIKRYIIDITCLSCNFVVMERSKTICAFGAAYSCRKRFKLKELLMTENYSAWLTAVYDIVLGFKIGQPGQNPVFIPLKTDFSIFKLYRHNNSSRRFVV